MAKSVQLGGGRPRKPTAQKALAGTLRPSRENPAEPSLTPAPLPEPPANLTAFERQAWEDLRRLIDPMQIATAADVYAFRRMVECAGVLSTLRASFYGAKKNEGKGKPVYAEPTQAGMQLRMRPEINAIPTYEKLMMLHMARWGIDPADRSRVRALKDEAPKVDKVAKFRVVGGGK